MIACAAGAVSHAHAGGALEPAVLLHTSLPPDGGALAELSTRVDVHSDGPGSETVTVRALTGDLALSWHVPVAPLVAALPGQLGDDGRMVLLAVIDAAPVEGFWARPVDCAELAAELPLPVADLVEALRGRLIPWLTGDLEELLHLDAHDRAVEHSPAQTVANAVLASYRGDLEAEQSAMHLVRALVHAPEDVMVEMGGRLCAALATAVRLASSEAVAAVVGRTGPFEGEALRLLDQLPAALAASPPAEQVEVTMEHVVAGQDRDESVRAAVAVTAGLAREVLGPGVDATTVLQQLGMVDDAGLARLGGAWVTMARAAAGPASGDAAHSDTVVSLLRTEGPAGAQWLRGTAATLGRLAERSLGRQRGRLAAPLEQLDQLLSDPAADPTNADVLACLALARAVRQRGGLGPAVWWTGRPRAAASAVGAAYAEQPPALDDETAADLLLELLEDDVSPPELLDALVCATSHLLLMVDPEADPVLRTAQLAQLRQDTATRDRWLLDAVLHGAPEHDPVAADLRPLLVGPGPADPDRQAERAGRAGLLGAGLRILSRLGTELFEETRLSTDDLLSLVLPTSLETHELFLADEA